MTTERELWTDFIARREGAPSPAPPVKTTTATRSDLEFKIQSGFIDWIRIVEIEQYPELQLLYAIPNGGNRHPTTGAKMKREGVKRGVPDLHLPIARGPYHSLYLETKVPGGKPSKWQEAFMQAVEDERNCVKICYGIDELIREVLWYLKL